MSRVALSALLIAFLYLVPSPAAANWIGNIQFSPESPAYVAHATRIDVTFDYEVTEPEGIGVQVYPWCYADPLPDFSWSGMTTLTGTGTHTTWFKLNSGSLDITHVKVRAWNASTSDTVFEFDLPVEYHFSDHGVYDIEFSPGAPAILGGDHMLHMSFDYATTWPTGILVFAFPYSGGTHPGEVSSGSPTYSTGFGLGDYEFRPLGSDVLVDRVLVRVENAERDQVLLEFFTDTMHFFGGVFPTSSPAQSSRLILEQNEPNPFNPSTAIRFEAPASERALLSVYDLRGRHVVDLWEGPAPEGEVTAQWDGRDRAGRSVASGVYVVRLKAGELTTSRSITLVR